MFFGQGAKAGNPPPIVYLDGYGSHYFPHVPCVITNFTHNLPNDVDYIEVPVTTTTLEETAIQPDNTNIGSVNYLENDGMKHIPNFGSKKASMTNATKMAYKSVTKRTRVPTTSNISVSLKPMYSRKNLHERFDLEKFGSGLLLQTKKFGGFI